MKIKKITQGLSFVLRAGANFKWGGLQLFKSLIVVVSLNSINFALAQGQVFNPLTNRDDLRNSFQSSINALAIPVNESSVKYGKYIENLMERSSFAGVKEADLNALFCDEAWSFGWIGRVSSKRKFVECSPEFFQGMKRAGYNSDITFVIAEKEFIVRHMERIYRILAKPTGLRSWLILQYWKMYQIALNEGATANIDANLSSGRPPFSKNFIESFFVNEIKERGFAANFKTSGIYVNREKTKKSIGYSDDDEPLRFFNNVTGQYVTLDTSGVSRTDSLTMDLDRDGSDVGIRKIIESFKDLSVPTDYSEFGERIGPFSFPALILFVYDTLDARGPEFRDEFYLALFATFDGRLPTPNEVAAKAAGFRSMNGNNNTAWLIWSDLFAFKGNDTIRSSRFWKQWFFYE